MVTLVLKAVTPIVNGTCSLSIFPLKFIIIINAAALLSKNDGTVVASI